MSYQYDHQRTNGYQYSYRHSNGYENEQWHNNGYYNDQPKHNAPTLDKQWKKNGYHHDNRRDETYQDTQPVKKAEVEEDEFELFLNGPFPKK